MAGLKSIAEVANDHRDDQTGKYSIDVYLTGDEDETGFVIAEVDSDGNVEWRSWPAGVYYERAAIYEAIEEAKQKQLKIKRKLVKNCMNAIVHEVESGDLHAIDELLMSVPTKCLNDFLPDNFNK